MILPRRDPHQAAALGHHLADVGDFFRSETLRGLTAREPHDRVHLLEWVGDAALGQLLLNVGGELERGASARLVSAECSNEEQVIVLAGEADAILNSRAKITARVLQALPRCKVIARYGIGVDNIDVAAATRRGIVATNTPDVLTDATADLTWALILAVARRVVEGDRWAPSGTWPGWAPTQMLGTDFSGKTLGIIGMGRIGQAVALRAQGFRMPVLYTSRRPCSSPPGVTTWIHRPLEEVLMQADFLSLHVPLSETTRHRIG